VTSIRAAATIILTRKGCNGPEILMGQRGSNAAFMPSKFVFPGGAVDAADTDVPFARPPDPHMSRLLTDDPPGPGPDAICAAAIRELWEESGLALGRPGKWDATPAAWRAFSDRGLRPDAGALRFIFRAITPPGRPRRFDARFFLADADDLHGDPMDFTAASDELSFLSWVTLSQARALDLPFITEVVLAEVGHLFDGQAQSGGIPFFDNSGQRPRFLRLV
jgi:8-oxo-dGTP pyrophosphatase MutT (NUDIX family)